MQKCVCLLAIAVSLGCAGDSTPTGVLPEGWGLCQKLGPFHPEAYKECTPEHTGPETCEDDWCWRGRFDDQDVCLARHSERIDSCDDETDDGPVDETGSDAPVLHCTDPNNGVCTELLTAEAADDYEAECAKDGVVAEAGPCTSRSGPTCLEASATANGTPIQMNIFWGANFCMQFPWIDTAGTCADLAGIQQGTHCSPP